MQGQSSEDQTNKFDAVAIVSGGMDSATMLYQLLKSSHVVKALSFDYGQRHKKEIQAAQFLCQLNGVEHEVVDLTILRPLLDSSSLTNDSIDVPDGHYSDETMKLTVVPNRNMIMLSIAIGHAVRLQADFVAYGAHSGDHAIYPDCREEFASAMNVVSMLCDWHKVRLMRPFIDMDKADIASLGDSLGVPWEHTWTCYKGLEKHCGTCGSCTERIEAFDLAGVVDPMTRHITDPD